MLGKPNRRLVFGVLKRMMLHKKRRQGKSLHSVTAMQGIDWKRLWRMRIVDADAEEKLEENARHKWR